ncbi:hypothetical protein [Chitinophaga sp. HK235]|uniref:hypothetical protein n=1 Tax=Chitinophaga sp. HK235 TaxID=2952571 RepID=UPI001BA767EC|nr:hypothetical protein [Chitinophaga sp. HK235]
MKLLLSLLCCTIILLSAKGQSYPDIVTYHTTQTATYGTKIKTNLGFVNGNHMPTIIIEGYNFGTGETIGLVINFYIYGDVFMRYNVASFGSFTPPMYLANEGGKVVIFMDSREYYQRFAVRAFAKGQADYAANYQGWTVADEAISPTATQKTRLTYQNKFPGQIVLPGNSLWTETNVGIGTTNPGSAKLAVEGLLSARKVKVTSVNPWPDYVFENNYPLMSLEATEEYIRTHKHLPQMPTAGEVATNGLDLGEMNRRLLEKMEEMTLHMIEMKKKINELEDKLRQQQQP